MPSLLASTVRNAWDPARALAARRSKLSLSDFPQRRSRHAGASASGKIGRGLHLQTVGQILSDLQERWPGIS